MESQRVHRQLEEELSKANQVSHMHLLEVQERFRSGCVGLVVTVGQGGNTGQIVLHISKFCIP